MNKLVSIVCISMLMMGCHKKQLVKSVNVNIPDTIESEINTLGEEDVSSNDVNVTVTIPNTVTKHKSNKPKRAYVKRSDLSLTVNFDFDKSDIRQDAKAIINKNIALVEHAQRYNLLVIIGGHCDERGTKEYNYKLGTKRANAVADELVNRGFNPSNVSISSYGEDQPVDARSCEEAWAKNRRVEIIVHKGIKQEHISVDPLK